MSRKRNSLHNRVRRAFDRPALKRVCEMHELDFPTHYPDLKIEIVEERKHNNFYYFADHGSDILFVAHLDTVVAHEQRLADFAETKAGPVIHCGSLDDRLGAYIGLELLPALGLTFDWLLTVGEESGQSTAEFFDPKGKEYKWVIEFDRKGTDVVMYQYDDTDTRKLVRECGAKTGHGSFSDIAELEHLGVKCFNWGAGYDGNYHSVKGYAYLEDTYLMVGNFIKFWWANKDTRLPHEKKKYGKSHGGYGWGGWDDYDYGYGSRSVGGATKRRWDSVTKSWVDIDSDGKDVVKDLVRSGDSGGYHGHGYDDRFDNDPVVEGKVRVNGRNYDSYEDWWKEAHPDEKID